MGTGTGKMDASSSSPSLGNIPGKLLCYTVGGIREKGKSNKGLVSMELNQFEMPSGLLVHLHLASVVEPGGMSKTPALLRDKVQPGKERFGGDLHPHLEQGRMLLVEKSHGCGCRFFLSYR